MYEVTASCEVYISRGFVLVPIYVATSNRFSSSMRVCKSTVSS